MAHASHEKWEIYKQETIWESVWIKTSYYKSEITSSILGISGKKKKNNKLVIQQFQETIVIFWKILMIRQFPNC